MRVHYDNRMIVGFTGTQGLMTANQHAHLHAHILSMEPEEFHHGGCVGADHTAHHLVHRVSPLTDLCVHWCNIKDKQANLKGEFESFDELPPLERNHKIVDAVDVLLAAPLSDQEVLRSGTWATIRYAEKRGVRVIMLPRKPL